MNIGQWVRTNRLTDEQLAIAEELNNRGIETFTDAVFAIGEPALAIITSSIAEPIAGLAGIGMAAFDGVVRGTNTIKNVKTALSYVPKTRAGKAGMQAVADTLQPLSDALTGAEDYLGSNTLELTGSPLLAAAAATVPAAIAEMNPLGRASRQADKMGIFAGQKAKTADLNKQAMADELLSRGVGRDEIWKETGWFKDVDEQWKFEIDDSQARLRYGETKEKVRELEDNLFGIMDKYGAASPEFKEARAVTGDIVLSMNDKWRGILPQSVSDSLVNDSLFKNYPEAGNIQARLDVFQDKVEGSFNTDSMTIKAQGSPSDTKSVLLHELQHSVQDSEGFAQGGSASDFDMGRVSATSYIGDQLKKEVNDALQSDIFKADKADLKAKNLPRHEVTKTLYEKYGINEKIDKIYELEDRLAEKGSFGQYQRLAGEAEARNVQTRMDMTPAERIARPPWTTLDVPESELIIKK
jgi:hypothetical protein